ncbi:MAG: IclR family transcriptional regulator [Bifidobacteriaceae bacterium]|nr:IclR family transcriptional regulator [Bifidobacteriaceae bacterium]
MNANTPFDDSAAGRERYRVQVADRLLAVLDLFLEPPHVYSLGQAARLVSLPRATCFRLLATLEANGYVIRDGTGYRLDFKCLLLGNVVRASLDLQQAARPVMTELRDLTGESAQLAVLRDWQTVYLEHVLSHRSVAYITARAGSILPAYCTGLGKALLAFQPTDAVKAWAERTTLERVTASTITTVPALLAELEAIRQRGFATDLEEREIGVSCVAAPIRDGDNSVIAAVSVAGPTERMPADLAASDTAQAVLGAARSISRRLGWIGPT